MKEIGIDITGQHSKASQELKNIVFDVAVTVCDRTKLACPFCSANLELPTIYPRSREVIHKSFEDPAQLWDLRKRNSRSSGGSEMR